MTKRKSPKNSGSVERLVELRARRQKPQLFGMPRAFQMGLKPPSSCSSMLASFAPMLLLRDRILRTAAGLLAIGNASSFSDVYRRFQVILKPCIAAE